MSEKELPPGFEYVFDDTFGGRRRIVVPTKIKEMMEAEYRERVRVSDALEKAKAQAEFSDPDFKTFDHQPASTRHSKSRDSVKATWSEIELADSEYSWDKRRFSVFKGSAATSLANATGDESEVSRLQDIYDELTKRETTLRVVAHLPSLEPLRQLAIRQPHMKGVVDFVSRQLMLAAHSQVPIRLQPMLLLSEPGVGKTFFCQALAKALNTTIRIERMDSDITNSFLTGSDKKWSNTRHGALFEVLVRGEHANPVFLLDELDKAQRTRYGSPVDALYSVLEPLTGKCVRDISLEFEFDASLVTWIATANDARLIPEPLRSRFREFHIMPPSAEEALVLAYGVIDETIQNSGMPYTTFDRRICRYVAHLPARRIFQLTLDAVAKVVTEGRSRLEKRDLPAELLDDSSEEPARNRLH